VTRALGLDLSTTRSGVACADGTLHAVTPKAGANDRARRLSQIIDQLDPLIARGHPELAVIEGPAGVRFAHSALVLGELRGAVMLRLFQHDVPAVEVPPKSLKHFATGNGNAGKDEMVAAAQSAGARIGATEHDKADAFWARRLGEQYGAVATKAQQAMSDAALLAWLKNGGER
jgi:Holliday junction resolvasome RuvABC endonuclease subunit